MHGPSGCCIEPGSVDEAARRAAIAEHHRHAEAAADLRASCYVVHPDPVDPPGPRDPAGVAALQCTIADLTAMQRERGVPIAMEDLPGLGASHFTRPGDVELGELGLALDCGHAAFSSVPGASSRREGDS